MVLSLEMGALRNAFALSVAVNVLFFPLVMLNIILNKPISTFWVDVESHKAWSSVATLPSTTSSLIFYDWDP
eukprot:4833051-Prorocentrum_lima.AAC.1